MLAIVRHGRTAANASGLLLGRIDPDLDDEGRRQAECIVGALGPVARVVSSPLARARQTAAAFGTDVEVDERWIELDYGELDGKPLAELPAELWARWRADIDYTPPGGESLAALGVRVRAACADLLDEAGTRTIVVVTHVSPMKAAVAWALGAGDEATWRMYVAPGAISRIGSGPGGGPVLRSFNETAHYTT